MNFCNPGHILQPAVFRKNKQLNWLASSLGGKQNISDIMQLIMGESSHWINKNKLTRIRFEWQDDYYAVSIGINQLANLREYIRKQIWHHSEESLEQEIDRLIEEYKLERMKD